MMRFTNNLDVMIYVKNKYILFFSISILFMNCEGPTGPMGSQGLEGVNSLINISDENSSANCENGGIRVDVGLDINSNGILEINEIQNTKYICNGNNGNNSLTTIVTEVSGGNCGNGGVKISYGLDLNGNSILDTNEVSSTTYVCNGIDGNISLINITEEDSLMCENGGIKIESGIDANKNNILDTVEIQVTKYICNGIDGIINEEIRLRIADGVGTIANTTSSTPVMVSGINFDIREYVNVGSIHFESDPYVANSINYALLELYNVTDGVVIANTLIRTNNLFSAKQNLETLNIIDEFPQREIVLGIKLSSEINGEFSASGISYLVLKRSN